MMDVSYHELMQYLIAINRNISVNKTYRVNPLLYTCKPHGSFVFKASLWGLNGREGLLEGDYFNGRPSA
jgi:hypothetical protein